MSPTSSSITVEKHVSQPCVVFAYTVFISIAVYVYQVIADGEFSSILTLGEIFECGALVILAMQVASSGSAAGISATALALEAAALCCKLSSTLFVIGYLPNDASGAWFFQATELCSLFVVMWLLREVLVKRASSYQADEDSAPHIRPIAAIAIAAAVLLHGDSNDFVPLDISWMAGLFLGVIAVLPQLWLITSTGGKADPLTTHYVAMMALGRIFSGTFMWYARWDIGCEPWVEGVNHTIWAILSAHLLHLLFLTDFAVIYVRTMLTKGIQADFQFDVETWV